MSTLNPQHPGLGMWQMKYPRKKFLKIGKTKKNFFSLLLLYVVCNLFWFYRGLATLLNSLFYKNILYLRLCFKA